MKFSCYKQDLIDALQFVIKAVAVKPMTPVLAGIYIKAEGAQAELQANNFSMGIITRIPVNTEIPGEVVVSGKRLFDFVRNMPDDTITFNDETGKGLEMQSGGATIELLTMTAGDFPKVKTPNAECSIKIPARTLYDLIRKTVFAAAKDESRPVFTGCAFELRGDKISLVATNTHRLALAKADLPDSYGDYEFVVPAETLRSLQIKINPQADNFIIMSYSGKYLSVEFDNFFVSTRLIEGKFPPYDRVIPKESTTRVNVGVQEFRSAIDIVALMARETEYKAIRFDFSDGDIEISSNSPDVGGAAKNVEAQIDGDDLDIAFNYVYITDVLRATDSPKVNIALTDQYSPAMFTFDDDPDYCYIATPMRV